MFVTSLELALLKTDLGSEVVAFRLKLVYSRLSLPGTFLFLAYFSLAFGDLGFFATDNVLFGLNLLLDLLKLYFLGLELLVKFVTVGRLEDVLLADDLL